MVLPKPGDVVAAGVDLGFRSDSSALCIVHKRGNMLIVGELLELRPEDGMPLKVSKTCERFVARMKAHGCTYCVGDRHYQDSLIEYLVASGLSYCPAPNTPADAYVRARVLFREGRVRIPNNQRLLQQLRETEARPTSGGGLSISHRRWAAGGHGDLVSALVLALFQLGGDEVTEVDKHERVDQGREARRIAYKASQEKSAWQKEARPAEDRGARASWRR